MGPNTSIPFCIDHNLKAVATTLTIMRQSPLSPLPTDTHFERLQASAPLLQRVYLPLLDFLEENGQMGLAVILALHSESLFRNLWRSLPLIELNVPLQPSASACANFSSDSSSQVLSG